VWHFLEMLARDDIGGNWGTSMDNSKWDIDGDTYINGILLTVDKDFYCGYLLEIVERDSSVVSYLVVTPFHGPATILDDDGVKYIKIKFRKF